jgi:putative spermidine/putrescine transport system permease protein
MSDHANQPMLAADGTPLKRSLARALRREKLRALGLIAPLLIFVLITFVMPIGTMLFRSVENRIVSDTLPMTTFAMEQWQATGSNLPPAEVYEAAYFDFFVAAEGKKHTRLGSRLNYETPGVASTVRKSGRKLDDVGKDALKELSKINPVWKDKATLYSLFITENPANSKTLVDLQRARIEALEGDKFERTTAFGIAPDLAIALPRTAREYTVWALYTALIDQDDFASEKPWEAVHTALKADLVDPRNTSAISALSGPAASLIQEAQAGLAGQRPLDFKAIMIDADDGWEDPSIWTVIKVHAPKITSGYFLNAVDMQKTLEGPQWQPENKQVVLTLFVRTVKMSLIITAFCILLGYPVAWILANLPMRQANMLMILVLLPFWTSLLVRTSAWKIMLQQQGVINEFLVWLGVVATDNRLDIINNQIGTITAMTHILLPFMILPMYSVMQTIPPTYLRAAKSLGATNWTAFWRVYFPQSIAGIGAGSILVFILAIGYYITPEIVGGTQGIFISNRIAYHISSTLNWGLAAALGSILLAVVLVLYWVYDKIVGIDNVKLG